ncbi:phenylalanine--tRNA ligase subunit beta [bacterium]|nr:phenylalanine--tRNA ligase subunit beta [bacterium]
MKFLLSWVKEYVDIPVSPEVLADRLSRSGLEVEDVVRVGAQLSHIITGRIESLEKHPNADRLQITQISDGKNRYQIVTGAQNVAVGDIVPVSLPGAVLANGLKIKPSQLRGVQSDGMLCSETELGVADTSNGIWILPPSTPVGVDFVEYGMLSDVILDISILPNRGDCQSILGLAREISVVLDCELRIPDIRYKPSILENRIGVRVDVPEICPMYIGRYVTGVSGETPLFMQRRLALSGIRSINLAVDITNYVMLEIGQPLHVFNVNALPDFGLSVGVSATNEMIHTLDDEVRQLPAGVPVIRSGNEAVAVAGVIGGKSTGVTESTADLFLESAYFVPSQIRRSEMTLGLRTESAVRFEKGVDAERVRFASDRALHLLQTLGGAQIAEAASEFRHDSHMIFQARSVPLDSQKVNRLLGTNYSNSEMVAVLTRLGFRVENGVAHVPSWRLHDIKEWPCLAEEIARIKGYDPIAPDLNLKMVPQDPPSRIQVLSDVTESYFVNHGFQQVQTFTMISPDDFSATKVPLPSEWLQIQNPLNSSESVLRRYLMASMLKTIAYNIKRQADRLRLFEVGKVFYVNSEGNIRENLVCGAMIAGSQNEVGYLAGDKGSAVSFPHLKGQLEALLDQMGLSGFEFSLPTYPQYHPTQSADLRYDGRIVGNVGILHPDVLRNYDIQIPIGYIGINLTALAEIQVDTPVFQPFSKYPFTRRDMALLVPKTISYHEIDSVIRAQLPESVVRYFVFDYFESEKIGADNKSLAIGFIYQDANRTLSDDEVNQAHENMCNGITSRLPVTIR